MQINVRKRYAAALLAVAVLGTSGAAYAATDDGPTDAQAQAAVDLLDQYVKNRPTVTTTATATVTASPTATETVTATQTATQTVTQTVPGPTTTKTVTVTATPTTESPSPTPTTESPTPTPTTPTPTPTDGTWLSGVGLDLSNNVTGAFATYRGEPVGLLGGWDDTKEAQTAIWTLDVGVMKTWNGPMDIAVGAIYNGESWANAANGSYDSRWRTSLTNMKTKLGTRNPNLVNIRFAHEMNGNWTEWKVPTGQEANFRAALTRYSNIRYEVFGATNAPQLVLCPNDGTSSGMADFRNLFVAKDSQNRKVVDIMCVDTYNSWPNRTDKSAIVAAMSSTGSNGLPVGVEAHRKFAESVGVPFAVGEWGNCASNSLCDGGGNESPAYVQAMNEWFRAHAGDPANPKAGDLLYEAYFDLWDQYRLYPSSKQPNTANAYAALVWGK